MQSFVMPHQPKFRYPAFNNPNVETLSAYREQLRTTFMPGQRISDADLHRVIWPGASLIGLCIRREYLKHVACKMQDADLLTPRFHPEFGDGWTLTPSTYAMAMPARITRALFLQSRSS